MPRCKVWREGWRTACAPALHLHQVLLHSQIADDEVLPGGGVFAHKKGEELVRAREVVQVHRIEPDVLADEVLEFAGGDFAESLEPGNLVAGAERADGGLLLVLGVT